VARGPLPNGFFVTDVLDPERGYLEGRSSVSRRYPLLPRLGPYESGNIEHPLLDRKWPCSEMTIPNVFRRSLRLYVLPTTDQRLPTVLANARDSMFAIPDYPALSTLDGDDDIYRFRGHHIDFHPRIRHPYPGDRLVAVEYCELDAEVVRREEVERLIDALDEEGHAELRRISRLPRRMTDFFLDLYGSEVARLQGNIAAWQAAFRAPRTSPQRSRQLSAWIAQAQRELNRIEPFVAPLEAYQARLNAIEDDLRAQMAGRVPGDAGP
jgi:hypothetical protein